MSTEETAPTPKPSRRPAVLGFIVWAIARFIGITLRIRYENAERIKQTTENEGAILVTWHGRTLIPGNVFRGRGYWALISLSRDGEIQTRIFRRLGFQIIRGSTGKSGARAVIQLVREIRKGGVLALTPDGPRGPTHEVQQGTIFLAQRCGCPVLPYATSARPRKLLGSWDSYMIPAPFARVAFVVGEPIRVPADLDDEGKERIADEIGRAIDACEKRAEELMGFRGPQVRE